MAEVARGYCNLEFDLDDGERGRRTSGVARLLRELTGAEAATVVNNNAGATVLALRALAAGREVIVSRGSSSRSAAASGCRRSSRSRERRLREVGTTNKTRLSDYRAGDRPRDGRDPAGASQQLPDRRLHRGSPLDELVQLAHARALDDRRHRLGCARPRACPPGVADEPTAAEGIAAGADLVLFSGDKLLGGPQCGIMAGTREAIGRIEADPSDACPAASTR